MDYIFQYDSPIGALFLRSDGAKLTGLSPVWFDGIRSNLPVFEDARHWLDAYFRGEAPDPRGLPLALAGTVFQQAVWAHLLTVSHGHSLTYGEIARAIGKPHACRAVGQAVGRNPIGIIIPCHRILGAGNKLTGFSWGIDKKKWLLRHEGVIFLDHP